MSAADDKGWVFFAQPIRGRSCGSCTACCTRIAVDLDDGYKPQEERCKHLCSKGCSIYKRRPRACAAWSCRWLFDPLTAGMRRPDRSGIILDPMLDTIIKDGRPVEVAQVWIDPRRPTVHEDPELRAFLVAIAARHGLAAIVRFAYPKAMVVVAPSLSGLPDWIEQTMDVEPKAVIDAKLAQLGTTGWLERL